MLLRGSQGAKCSEISSFSGLEVDLARIEAIFPRLELPDHLGRHPSSAHAFARFGAAPADFRTLLHLEVVSEALAVVSAFAANIGAGRAGLDVKRGFGDHKARGGFAERRAIL